MRIEWWQARIRLLIVLGLALFCLGVEAVDPPKFDNRWKRCRRTVECTVVKGVCGPDCVHKRFAKKAQDFFEWAGPSAECMPAALERQVQAVCQENRCQCRDVLGFPTLSAIR